MRLADCKQLHSSFDNPKQDQGNFCERCNSMLFACAGDAQSWRLLATAHAENDNDEQAISAALRALDAAPSNAGVLLALGVSHVNELQQGEAVGYLLRCVSC